jgi:hypothetical protein
MYEHQRIGPSFMNVKKKWAVPTEHLVPKVHSHVKPMWFIPCMFPLEDDRVPKLFGNLGVPNHANL